MTETTRALLAACPNVDPAVAVGAIIAVVRFGTSHRWLEGTCRYDRPCTAWSDQTHGMHHWPVALISALSEPVPCKGALGLWRLPEDAEKAVRAQLETTPSVPAGTTEDAGTTAT